MSGSDLGADLTAVSSGAGERRARDVDALSAAIIAAPLATRGLARWCEARKIGLGPITVGRRPVSPPPLDPRSAALLGAGDAEIVHRQVEIRRGAVVLVDADNWYVAERLTAEMRDALAATDRPFGEVIAPLGPVRETYAVRRLSGPHALEHRAVVRFADGAAVAIVHERYRAVLVD